MSTAEIDSAISGAQLRDAVGRFASGVTVVTTLGEDGAPIGCTVSAFSSVSLDPPLVLVCIDNGRFMHRALTTGVGFVINVLAADQADLAMSFARPAADKFTGVPFHRGRGGVPLLDGALAHLQCDRYAVLDGGDHAIVLGRVMTVGTAAGEPLLYSQGAFLDINRDEWDRAVERAPHEWLLSAPW